MEKEFIIDQEDVQIIAIDDTKEEEIEEVDYSSFSEEDFATIDENEIDWGTL